MAFLFNVIGKNNIESAPDCTVLTYIWKNVGGHAPRLLWETPPSPYSSMGKSWNKNFSKNLASLYCIFVQENKVKIASKLRQIAQILT